MIGLLFFENIGEEKVQLFDQQKIRSAWDAMDEKWYFAIVDVIAALTESTNPQIYWRVLKKRLSDEGNETVTNCNGLNMHAPDGKMRMIGNNLPSTYSQKPRRSTVIPKTLIDDCNSLFVHLRKVHP